MSGKETNNSIRLPETQQEAKKWLDVAGDLMSNAHYEAIQEQLQKSSLQTQKKSS